MSLEKIILEYGAEIQPLLDQIGKLKDANKSLGSDAKKTGQDLSDGFIKGSNGAQRFEAEMKRVIKTQADAELKVRNLQELLRDDTKLGSVAFRKVQGEIAKTVKELQRVVPPVNSIKDTMIGLAGAVAAAFSVKKVIDFTKASIAAYDVQIKAEQSLLVAAKGRVSVQQELIKQAGELQKITLFGDEQTIQAQSRMLALGLEADQIRQLIPLVQDLASAKGIDLVSASQIVSQSVKGTSDALKRQFGISIKEAKTEAERLTAVIEGLNNAVGGEAQAAAGVGSGAITQAKNAWGDFTEQIGRAVVAFGGFIISGENAQRILSSLNDGAIKFADVLESRAIPASDKWSYFLSFFNVAGGQFIRQSIAMQVEAEKQAKANAEAAREEGVAQLARQFTLKQLEAMRNGLKENTQEYKNVQQAIRILSAEESKQAEQRESQLARLKELQDQKTKALQDYIKAVNEAFREQQDMFASEEDQLQASLKAAERMFQSREQISAEEIRLDNQVRSNAEQALKDLVDESDRQYRRDAENYKRSQAEKEAAFRDFVGAVQNLSNSLFTQQLALSRQETDVRIRNLNERFQAGIISEQDYNRRVLQLQREQFDREKSLNRSQALINGAVAATAVLKQWAGNPIIAGLLLGLTAASVGLQVATINAQTPGFKEGGYTGDKGVSEVAGVTHGQEYVIPAAPTKRNRKLLEAIHKGKEADYIAKTYVEPALKSMKSGSTAERMAASIGMQFDDTGLRYEIRRNNKVRLHDDTLDALANKIGQKQGVGKILRRRGA